MGNCPINHPHEWCCADQHSCQAPTDYFLNFRRFDKDEATGTVHLRVDQLESFGHDIAGIGRLIVYRNAIFAGLYTDKVEAAR